MVYKLLVIDIPEQLYEMGERLETESSRQDLKQHKHTRTDLKM